MAEAKKTRAESGARQQKQAAKPAPSPAPRPKAQEGQQPKPQSGLSMYLSIAVVAILIVLIVYVIFDVVPNLSGVPFSTFKTNFNSAPKVALVVSYSNNSQYSATLPCATELIQIIGRTRNASSIDFYLVNQTTCTYSSSGLGSQVQVATANASTCLATANAEPSIFLNYSDSNSTLITPSHLYLKGNSGYFAACQAASEFA